MKNEDRIIKIMRTDNGSPTFKQPKDGKGWLDKSIRIISPRNVSPTDRRYYTGLGFYNGVQDNNLEWENKKILFSDVLGILYDGNSKHEFNNSIVQYYDSLSVDIPATGKVLNIGLEDNSKPLSSENRPLSIEDYIIYKAVFENRPFQVAKNKEEAQIYSYCSYYIHDVSNEERNKLEQLEKEGLAISHYTDIKEDRTVVKTLMSEAGIGLSNDADKNKRLLYEYITKNSAKFEEFFADYKREGKFYGNRLRLKIFISHGFISKTSYNGYLDAMSGDELAKTHLEMLNYFKNPENAEVIAGYQSRYREKVELITG